MLMCTISVAAEPRQRKDGNPWLAVAAAGDHWLDLKF